MQEHAPVFGAFLQVLAGPILQGLEGMADVVDLVQTKQDVPDYPTIAEEADAVRREARGRGQVMTRKQAVALVKSRRMDDPKYVDELVDRRARERADDARPASRTSRGGRHRGRRPRPAESRPRPDQGPAQRP